MTARKLWITGSILFLFFVLANTPAKIALALLPRVQDLELNTVTGSIWSGSIQNIHYRGIDFGEGNWEISPWSLLLLTIKSEIHSKNELSKLDAEISLSPGGVSSDSIKARLPAEWIPKLSGVPIKTEGKVLIRIIQLQHSAGSPLIITGSVAWQEAVLQTPFSSNKAQLGNLQMDISSQADALIFDLRDNQGALGLDAKIQFNPPNKIVAKGSINENLPAELANFFQFFAKPDHKGKLLFDYSGKIPGL